MSTRDPRQDPQKGDVIAKQLKRGVALREVRERNGRRVVFSVSHLPWTQGGGVDLVSWVAWAKDSVVVSVAGESTGVLGGAQ